MVNEGSATPPTLVSRPFAITNFRRQWAADLTTSCAFEIETLALAWYVLTETGSVVLMAAVAAVQYLGTLVSPLIGANSDSIGPRNTMLAMRVFYTCIGVTILLCASAGLLSPWFALALTTISGLIRPSDQGMRNVVTSAIVPGHLLLPAIGLSRITVDGARIAGTMTGAAFMATLGISGAYCVVVALYLLAVSLTASLRIPGRAVADKATTTLGQLKAAMKSVRGAPAQTVTMIMAFFVNFSAYPFVLGLLPYVAKNKFDMGELGLGLLISTSAAGCVTSSVVLSRIRLPRPAITMLTFSIVWHCLIVVFALTPSVPFALAILFLAGISQGLCMIPMAAFLLSSVSPAVRGGVVGLRSMAVYGLPLGLMATGYALNQGMAFWLVACVFGTLGIAVTIALWVAYRPHLNTGLDSGATAANT